MVITENVILFIRYASASRRGFDISLSSSMNLWNGWSTDGVLAVAFEYVGFWFELEKRALLICGAVPLAHVVQYT